MWVVAAWPMILARTSWRLWRRGVAPQADWLVVGVGEEVLDGGDEPALPRGVSSWGSSLGRGSAAGGATGGRGEGCRGGGSRGTGCRRW